MTVNRRLLDVLQQEDCPGLQVSSIVIRYSILFLPFSFLGATEDSATQHNMQSSSERTQNRHTVPSKLGQMAILQIDLDTERQREANERTAEQ